MVSTTLHKKTKMESLELAIERVFNVDQGIRMVAIYQGQHMLAGGMKKGVTSHDPDDAYDIDMQLSSMGDIAEAWQKWFGELETLSLRYEKVSLTFQPLAGGRFLVMSTEPEVDPLRVMARVRALRLLKIFSEGIP